MSRDEYYELLKAAHERTGWTDRDSIHAYASSYAIERQLHRARCLPSCPAGRGQSECLHQRASGGACGRPLHHTRLRHASGPR